MESISPAVVAPVGAALVTLGAAFGIGKLAAAAMDGIARQPEAGKNIQGAMVVAAGLIEGIAFLCAIVCLIALFR